MHAPPAAQARIRPAREQQQQPEAAAVAGESEERPIAARARQGARGC